MKKIVTIDNGQPVTNSLLAAENSAANGETKTYHSTVWTEKGRQFIHNLLNVQPCQGR